MSFVSVSGKNWIFKKFNPSDVDKFTENYSLNETVAKLISIRKKNIDNIDLYLDPKIKNLLPNPFKLKDMEKAVTLTSKKIINNELFGVFGDYDVDGATSSALLVRYFSSIKKKITTYIPDRITEGYGPNIKGFDRLIKNGASTIFTVDCGTLSFDAIKFAQSQNVDVIVLDHHQSDLKLPVAHSIINPNRFDEQSKLTYLCAAGVCFIFLVALNKKLRDQNWFKDNKISEPNILSFLDLVSLGTVCDVVPLIGLNRAIVKQGLKIIGKRSNLGLKTLYDITKVESYPTTFDLGFRLGPRINAGGRVGKSSHGVDLLTSNDPQRTYDIAMELEKSNKERQTIENLLSEKIIFEMKKLDNNSVIVLSGNNWHEGIIGIVASRIKDLYNKPTILISLDNDIGKGSCRSITGFDIGSHIIKAIQLNIIEKGGGHKMAAGFTIKKSNIQRLKDFLNKSFEKKKLDSSTYNVIQLDSIIAPSALNEDFYDEINFLSPFGPGNAEPKFVIENLSVISSKTVGEKHIKALLKGKDGSVFHTFSWNAKDSPLEPFLDKKNRKKFNIAGKMRLNQWKGKKNIEFYIEDISIN